MHLYFLAYICKFSYFRIIKLALQNEKTQTVQRAEGFLVKHPLLDKRTQ